MTRFLLSITSVLFIQALSHAQCYDDACDDNNDIPIPGCCTATTAGMTWSGYGDVGCVNMFNGSTGGNPDTWMSFTAPTTGYIELTIDNITQNGTTQYVVFDHQNAEVCSSLNSFGLLAGEGCNNLAGDGTGGTTWTDTVEYMVEAGERYWVLVSADVENGATAGTFELCINIVAPPPPPPPAPGQDCVDAQVLCNESGTGFYNGQLDLGAGSVLENVSNSWSSCIFTERSSQWYTFTASQSGTFEMMLTPDYYIQQNGPDVGDDFDWELYDITTSGCTDAAISLACDYSAAVGSTGYSATGAAGWGQVEDVDYSGDGGTGGTQWNTTSVSLTAGNTYAILIQNFSNSQGGVTVDFQGTAIMGPIASQALFNAVLDQTNCSADLTITGGSAIPNYTYTWDFGDGTTSTGSGAGGHTYTAPGTYIVSLTLTDPVGCSVSSQQIIDVADCTPDLLPVELTSFNVDLVQNDVHLRWVTASEQNCDHYVIEKSIDLNNWEVVTKVDGAGNSTQTLKYFAIDREPFNGTSYYRLVQVDTDGTKEHTLPRTVKIFGEKEIVKIVNVLGQEVGPNYKGVVLLIYNDGSSKTVYR